MATNVTKDGVVMGCRDDNQLAAFLNSGWKIVDEKATPKKEEPVRKAGRPKKEQ